MAKHTSTETLPAVPTTLGDIAIFDADQQDTISDILMNVVQEQNVRPTGLPKILIPRMTGGSFVYYSKGKQAKADELTAIILAVIKNRVYYAKGADEAGDEKTPPDCSSRNMIRGSGIMGHGSVANPSGLCENCPYNEWGSDPRDTKGKAKACKEKRVLVLMLPGEFLPQHINVGTSSIKAINDYMLLTASAGVMYHQAITKIRAEIHKKGAQEYGSLVLSLEEIIPNGTPEAKALKDYIGALKSIWAAQAAADDRAEAKMAPADAPDMAG